MASLRLLLTALLAAASAFAKAGDPTRPYQWQGDVVEQEQSALAEELQLNQIIAFANRSYAIINGQRYQPDDVINGYRIVAIHNQRVRLQNGKQELELTLFTSTVKRDSAEVGENQ